MEQVLNAEESSLKMTGSPRRQICVHISYNTVCQGGYAHVLIANLNNSVLLFGGLGDADMPRHLCLFQLLKYESHYILLEFIQHKKTLPPF